MNEAARINKIVVRNWMVVDIILVLAYTMELIKGERTVGYYAVFCLLALVPLIADGILYFQGKSNPLVYQIAAYAYLIFYVFVLLTGDTPLVFVYIFPMMVSIMVANHLSMFIIYAVVTFLANIAQVAYKCLSLHMTNAEDIANYEIQIAATLLVTVGAAIALKHLSDSSSEKIHSIAQKEQKQESMVETIMGVAGEVRRVSGQISDGMHDMMNDSAATMDSMQQITDGTAQTADSIQSQLEKTTVIQEAIDHSVDISNEIYNQSAQAIKDVQVGIDNMAVLSQGTIVVNENKEAVCGKMEALVRRMENAMECVSLIQTITQQTNLLALNASIEAARAGDMGRGFAVVAGEITELANQTKASTQEIEQILADLKADALDASDAVNAMAEASDKQSDIILSTEKYLKNIDASIAQVYDKSKIQANQINEIDQSNRDIVESIQTISAVSEEVTANSQQTLEITENSRNTVELLQNKVTELVAAMGRLDTM